MLLPKSTLQSLQVIQDELLRYSISIEGVNTVISRKKIASQLSKEAVNVILFNSRDFSQYVSRDGLPGFAKLMLMQWKKTGVDRFENLLMGARECVASRIKDVNGIRKTDKSVAIDQLSRVERCFQLIISMSDNPATQNFMEYRKGLRV
jgi:hypothetical protein